MGVRGRKPTPASERFHSKYEVDPDTGCWNWTAHRNAKGYGTIGQTVEPGRSTSIYAHRLSYEMHHGPIPEGLVVDHMCNNPSCVNPEHLQAITARANILRSPSPQIQTYWLGICRRGHDLNDPENVYLRPDNGKRMCKECIRITARERARRRGVPERQPAQPCGTYSACTAHYRRGEIPCQACKEAAAAYKREENRRKKRAG